VARAGIVRRHRAAQSVSGAAGCWLPRSETAAVAIGHVERRDGRRCIVEGHGAAAGGVSRDLRRTLSRACRGKAKDASGCLCASARYRRQTDPLIWTGLSLATARTALPVQFAEQGYLHSLESTDPSDLSPPVSSLALILR
jgi:hypothetical protein